MSRSVEGGFNVFERIDSVKEILGPICPKEDVFAMRGLVMRCVKYTVGQVKHLHGKEAQAYDLLLKNNLRPKTVYEWLLLEDVPPHLREKLIANKISLKHARYQYVQWKRMSGTRAGKEIMEDMRQVVRRLKWKSQEALQTQYPAFL